MTERVFAAAGVAVGEDAGTASCAASADRSGRYDVRGLDTARAVS